MAYLARALPGYDYRAAGNFVPLRVYRPVKADGGSGIESFAAAIRLRVPAGERMPSKGRAGGHPGAQGFVERGIPGHDGGRAAVRVKYHDAVMVHPGIMAGVVGVQACRGHIRGVFHGGPMLSG